ncbi:MAG: shikimate dehydrogenase [Chloroflexia bacterium]|nr:shikimate dehydrogenase [Chloroflexia bacterium]
MLRVGVIGDPVAHSLSPALHQPSLDALGIPARYERWHTSADALPERVASLRAADALGASVTVPHKLAVMPLLDEIALLARDAGAVNTVVNRDGRLIGENTDVHGFAASLRESWGDTAFAAATALVLGAGGAALAVVLALHGLGVPAITVANRSEARARRLAADLGSVPIVVGGADRETLAETLRGVSILVNATSLGWNAGESPLELDLLAELPAGATVVDLTYRDTDLLVAARVLGLQTLDGLAMLVHQGAKALELWTGQAAPLAIMREAALRARGERA